MDSPGAKGVVNGTLLAVLGGLAVGGAALYLSKRKADADSPCVKALVAQGVPAELAQMGCAAASDPVGTVKGVNNAIIGALGGINKAVSFGIGGKGSVDNRCPCPAGLTSKAADAVSGPLVRSHFNETGPNGNPRVCVDAKGAIQGALDEDCTYRPWTVGTSAPPPTTSYQQPGTTTSLTGTRDHRH